MKTCFLKGSSHWSGLRSGQRAAALCGVFFLTIGLLFTGCPSPTDPPKKPPVVPGAVNKTALEAAIAEAGENIESVLVAEDGSEVPDTAYWVTADVKASYQDAIDAAKAVNDNAAATQAQVDAAKLALDEATETFDEAKQAGEFEVDKTELETAIAAALVAIEAVTVSEDGSDVSPTAYWVSQADKDTGSLQIDKTALEAAITAAGTAIAAVTVSVDGSDVSSTRQWVSQGDKDTYQAAIDAATGVLNNNAATQALVDEAVSELAAATTAFTEAQSAGTALSISGTLTGGRHWGIVKIWADSSATGTPISTVTLKNETAWQVAIPASYINSSVYATVEDNIYDVESAPVEIAVTAAGATEVELNFAITIPDGKNAALAYKTASVSANSGTNFLNAVDGKSATKWDIGNSVTAAELILDFGFNVTANAIAIRTADNYFNGLVISSSDNGTEWTTAYTRPGSSAIGTGGASSNINTPFWFDNAVTAKYFKLHLDIAATQSARNPGVWEFELYNSTLDRSALADAITAAETLLAATREAADGNLIPDSQYWAMATDISAYQTAINTAKAVLNNPAIDDQQIITDAVTALGGATGTFEGQRAAGLLEVDNTELLAAITAANTLKEFPFVSANNGSTDKSTPARNLYPNNRWVTEEAKTTYTQAITTANTVATDPEATQDEINDALDDLNTATTNYTGAFGEGTGSGIGSNANIAPRYQKVTASNVNSSDMTGAEAVDGSLSTRWATHSSLAYPAILELDFGSPVTIARWEMVAFAGATDAGRLKEFYIEYLAADGETWTPVYSRTGTDLAPIDGAGSTDQEAHKIGENLTENATAQTFRLRIKTSAAAPTIWEFRLITPNP